MKITSKFRMTARLSGTDLALRPLLCSKVPVISRFLKHKLCPPPFVSRVLLSWKLVDPYRYESSKEVFIIILNALLIKICVIKKAVSLSYFLSYQIVCYMYTAIVHHRQTGSGNAEVVFINN